MKMYDEAAMKNDLAANGNRPYQQCTITVMDTIADPTITFDENGVCNYYHQYLELERTKVLKGKPGLPK